MKIVVIGSGFGGLAAAIRLLAQGHEVTVVEKRDRPGGRAYVTKEDGFSFDNGPTIITAPWMIDELFAAAGKKTADYVKMVKLNPFYKIKFEDGTVFTYSDDLADIKRQIKEISPADAASYDAFMKHVEKIYHAGFRLITTPFHRFSTMLRALPELVRLRSDRSVAAMAKRYFRDERLQQIFSFHPLLIGGHPFESTSIYALIHKLEQESGVWFAMGGTGALIDGFVRLFKELGGRLMLSTEAERITIDPVTRRASGVLLKGTGELPCDAVVANGDVARTYMDMIPGSFRARNTDRHLNRLNYSMSLFVVYFGTNRRYDNIAHHEIIMGPRYKGLLDDIFKHKVLADDFSLYLHRPTATDPSLAPAGHDCWYVLSPVPNLDGKIDWAEVGPKYCDKILSYLEERHLPNLRSHIVKKFFIDPRHFRDNLNSHLGSAFSVAPTLFQSAWFRPHNVSEDIPNIFFAGAGTHPGAGLPGVISSGKIVSELVQTQLAH